jgi:hypothetical protein
MDPGELYWEDLEWIHLAQVKDLWSALVKMEMNFQVP